jgi:hypothetical protein
VAPRTRSRAVAASGAATSLSSAGCQGLCRPASAPTSRSAAKVYWARAGVQPHLGADDDASGRCHTRSSFAQPAAGAVPVGTADGSASAGARCPTDLATMTQAAVTRMPASSATR